MKKRTLMARILVGTIQFILPIGILFLGLWGLSFLIKSRPPVPKADRKVKATFVEVMTLHPQPYTVWVTAYGSLQAHRTLVLQPQVSGRVIEQNSDLMVGGLIPKGTTILKIDPNDYQANVSEASAAVTKAEFELKLEEGNQIVAEREWRLLDTSISTNELGKELALRQPHLQERKAALEAAKSRLFKAELDLERTVITAPFNALVISEMVEVGQIVAPQSSFATLVGTDEFQVQVSIPVSQLSWVTIPHNNSNNNNMMMKGADTRIIHELGAGKQVERDGQVLRLLGDVDRNGRLARVLVLVHDPLGLNQPAHHRHPLLIGSYVRVLIRGPVLNDVFVIPRTSLREGNRVWIKNNENKLEFRQVEVISRDSHSIVAENNLGDGVQIITSALPVAMQGMLLETETKANGTLGSVKESSGLP